MAFRSYKPVNILLLYAMPMVAQFCLVEALNLIGSGPSNGVLTVAYYITLVYGLVHAAIVTIIVLVISSQRVFNWIVAISFVLWLVIEWVLLHW